MKKIVQATDLGGAPIHKNDLRSVFNDEVWDAVEAIFSFCNSNAEGLIISGCTLTPNGGNWDISAGIVYLNGEFMRLSAATNQSLPKYIAPAAVVDTDRQFAGGATNTLFEEKKAELVGSAPGAGQYIAITTSSDPDNRRFNGILIDRYQDVQFEEEVTALKGIRTLSTGPYLLTKVIEIGEWDMDTGSVVNVSHGVDYKKIRSIEVIIRDDTDSAYNKLDRMASFSSGVMQGSVTYGSSTIDLVRLQSGVFDSTDFNLISGYNRGWITIVYEA